MKAAVYYGSRDIRVEDTPAPSAVLRPGEVRIRPLYAGICGTDVHEYVSGPDLIPVDDPHPLTGARIPQILGHEFSATVLEIGEGVHNAAVGDLVAVRPGIWCGRCAACNTGYQTSCPLFAAVGLSHPWGGLAEEAVVVDQQLIPMPAGVSPQQAALLEPAGVAVQAFSQTKLPFGGRLLITGAGPIGALSALVAAVGGVGEVIVSEPNPGRRDMLRKITSATVLDPRETHNVVQHGVDAVIEASGHPAGLDLAIRAIRPGGRIVQVGLHARNPEVAMTQLNLKQARLIASWCWPVMGWDRMAQLIADGRLPVERLITGVIPLEALVSDGVEALLDPQANHQKILIDVGAR